MSVHHLCRTCLSSSEEMFRLFCEDEIDVNTYIVEILQMFLQHPVLPDDNASNYICLNCLNKMQQTHEFMLQCRRSEKTFLQINESHVILNKLNNSEESEEYSQEANENVSIDRAKFDTIAERELVEEDDDHSEEELVSEEEESSDDILQCPACLDAFGMLSIFRLHLIEVHTMNSMCIMCNNEYFEDIWNHTRKHIPKNHSCIECGRKFVKHENLEKHIETNSNPGQMFSCDCCLRRFHTEVAHQKHFSARHTFVCDICSETFQSQQDLDHHKVLHSQSDEYISALGEEEFKDREYFENYLSSHNNISNDRITPVECSPDEQEVFEVTEILEVACDPEFGEQNPELTFAGEFEAIAEMNQSEIEIQNERNYQCDVCFKMFRDNTRLLDHRSIHTGEKPFECDICGKRFRVKRNLRAHLVSHSSKTPFLCSLCGNRYKKKIALMTHIQEKHGSEKFFPCSLCDTKAITIKDLSIHYRFSHPLYYSDIGISI